MNSALLVIGGIGLFIAGLYTGLWIQRHSYTDREVERLIPTDRLVEVEKPVIIQVPQGAPKQGPQLAVMGSGSKTDILTPNQRQEAEKMTSLLDQLAE